MNRRYALIVAVLLSTSALRALEIPLSRGSSKGGKGVVVGFVDMERIYQEFPETRKARQEYQEQAAKMKAVLTDKEAELSDLRDQLSILKSAMGEGLPSAVSTSAVQGLTVPTFSRSTSTVSNSSATVIGSTSTRSAVLPSTSTAGLTIPTASSSTVPVALSTAPAAPPMSPGDISAGIAQKERALAEEESSLNKAQKEAAKALAEFERKRAAQIFGKLYQALTQLADERGVDVVLDKSSLLYGQKGLDLTEPLSRRVRGLPDDTGEEAP